MKPIRTKLNTLVSVLLALFPIIAIITIVILIVTGHLSIGFDY
jgi:hypothetical protein